MSTTTLSSLYATSDFDGARRDKQHLVNLLALDGLYAAKDEVREALTPIPDRPRLILDLGENKSVMVMLGIIII